ncbi:MAG: type II toxin-antitoxin system PrlF family antitoxin [Chloroflexi bacterium]|nr:type II toxin-antitoxin system PrlF family antitoxin [Chloroflexota bacterium]
MKELETTLTRKGQVTIPQEVRRALGLKPRDKVLFEIEGEAAKIRPAVSKLLAGYGAVVPRKRPEDFRKLREEFEEGVAEEVVSET